VFLLWYCPSTHNTWELCRFACLSFQGASLLDILTGMPSPDTPSRTSSLQASRDSLCHLQTAWGWGREDAGRFHCKKTESPGCLSGMFPSQQQQNQPSWSLCSPISGTLRVVF
jgi:hypothetical protein